MAGSPRKKKTGAPTRAARGAAPRRAPAPAAAPVGKRARAKDATRRRIVAAALHLFETRGYDETTTRQIATRARVAEGTVFNYFETKEDIALHFFELEVDHAIAAVRTNPALRDAPLEERLFVLVQTQIEYLAPYERFIGASMVAALRPASRLGFGTQANALRERYLAFVQELVQDAEQPATFSPLTWVAPHAFWIYYLGVLLYWLHDRSPGKQQTLAFLDQSLRLGVAVLRGARGA